MTSMVFMRFPCCDSVGGCFRARCRVEINVEFQKLFENIIRKKLPPLSKANCFAVRNKQARIDEPCGGFEGWGDDCSAKLSFDSGDLDARVEAEAEEPGLFVLLAGCEPGSLDRVCAGEIGLKIVGGRGAQDATSVIALQKRFTQHGGGVESEAEIGAALPVAKVMA
jgi:hypothetical protein